MTVLKCTALSATTHNSCCAHSVQRKRLRVTKRMAQTKGSMSTTKEVRTNHEKPRLEEEKGDNKDAFITRKDKVVNVRNDSNDSDDLMKTKKDFAKNNTLDLFEEEYKSAFPSQEIQKRAPYLVIASLQEAI